jgi:hypothetical protein
MSQIDGKDEDGFKYWIDEQLGDDPKAEELYEFHGYIRENGLDPGTRLGYRKKVRDELNEDGYLEEYDEALPEDADSALKKYREFLQGSDNVDETDEGDNQSQ